MNLLLILDVLISLALVYLAASLFVTVANEYVAQFLQSRAKQLKSSLERLLDDDFLFDAIMNNPVVRDNEVKKSLLNPVRLLSFFSKKFSANKISMVSYIDTNIAAKSIVGALGKGKTLDKDGLKAAIATMKDSYLRRALSGIATETGDDLKEFTTQLSAWLEKSLTNMGDVYKRTVQTHSIIVGMIIAVGLNINTLQITDELYHSSALRSSMVNIAEKFTQYETSDIERCIKLDEEKRKDDPKCVKVYEIVSLINPKDNTIDIALPIGWKSWDQFIEQGIPDNCWESIRNTALNWLGWLLTALALSMGAPFWFDFLNKVVNIRHAMRKPTLAPPTEPKTVTASNANSGQGNNGTPG